MLSGSKSLGFMVLDILHLFAQILDHLAVSHEHIPVASELGLIQQFIDWRQAFVKYKPVLNLPA